jgi:hypothetical protein
MRLAGSNTQSVLTRPHHLFLLLAEQAVGVRATTLNC